MLFRSDWEGKVVDRCNRIPEVAGWWVLCHKCPRVTDWVRVGYRSDQATTLFPIATSWRSFVGCPRRTGVQSLYGDKRTSVVKPQCFPSRPFQSFSISICPQRVKGGCGRQADGTAGLPAAPEIARVLRHLRFVPDSDFGWRPDDVCFTAKNRHSTSNRFHSPVTNHSKVNLADQIRTEHLGGAHGGRRLSQRTDVRSERHDTA